MVECFKRGLFIQGLLHDVSKLLPCEFIPYMNFFTKKDKSDTAKQAFNKAWLHHIHCNPHHWEHWMLKDKCLEMPRNYIKEMIADWIGAGITITGKNDVLGWYDKNKDNMKLHPETRFLVEYYLGI